MELKRLNLGALRPEEKERKARAPAKAKLENLKDKCLTDEDIKELEDLLPF